MSRATAIVVGLCWKNIKKEGEKENNEIKKRVEEIFL